MGNGGVLAVDEGDVPVTGFVHVAHQRLRAAEVIGGHGQTVVEHVVDGHQRQPAVHQLLHLRVVKIHAGDDHAVQTAVPAVLQIRGGLSAHVVVEEGNVVAVGLRLSLEAFQHSGEVLMCQTAVPLVHKQHTQIIGAVGLQRTGGGVCHIAHLLRGDADPSASILSDILLTVQRLADRGHGYAATLCDVLHGYHRCPPSVCIT